MFIFFFYFLNDTKELAFWKIDGLWIVIQAFLQLRKNTVLVHLDARFGEMIFFILLYLSNLLIDLFYFVIGNNSSICHGKS